MSGIDSAVCGSIRRCFNCHQKCAYPTVFGCNARFKNALPQLPTECFESQNVLHWTPIKPWSLVNLKLPPRLSFYTYINRRVQWGVNSNHLRHTQKTHIHKIRLNTQAVWLTNKKKGFCIHLIIFFFSLELPVYLELKTTHLIFSRMLMEVNVRE